MPKSADPGPGVATPRIVGFFQNCSRGFASALLRLHPQGKTPLPQPRRQLHRQADEAALSVKGQCPADSAARDQRRMMVGRMVLADGIGGVLVEWIASDQAAFERILPAATMEIKAKTHRRLEPTTSPSCHVMAFWLLLLVAGQGHH